MGSKFNCIYDTGAIYGILSIINEAGEAKIADMTNCGREDEPCYSTLDKRLKMLNSMDMVRYEVTETGRMVRMYQLTSKGEAFLRLMNLGLAVQEGRVDPDSMNFLLDKLEADAKLSGTTVRRRSDRP